MKETFIKIDHIWGFKKNLSIFQKIEILHIWYMTKTKI